jgi:hypothetical protein
MKDIITSLLGIALGLFILIITVFGIGALEAYVCMEISDWFNIPVAKDLMFGQMFGLTILIGILTMKTKPKTKEDETEDNVKFALSVVFSKVTTLLATWALAWAMYKIILFYC